MKKEDGTNEVEKATRSGASELKDLLYAPHFLPGRGKRGGSQRVGVVHAVESSNGHGDNFNTAACGRNPSGLSLGWQTTATDVSCPKCKKALGI